MTVMGEQKLREELTRLAQNILPYLGKSLEIVTVYSIFHATKLNKGVYNGSEWPN